MAGCPAPLRPYWGCSISAGICVAFEFNGAQHYGPTQAFPSEQAFKELRTRDLARKGMSLEQGIALIEVTADDLFLGGMQKKIPDSLPCGGVDADGAYINALERIRHEYRSRVHG